MLHVFVFNFMLTYLLIQKPRYLKLRTLYENCPINHQMFCKFVSSSYLLNILNVENSVKSCFWKKLIISCEYIHAELKKKYVSSEGEDSGEYNLHLCLNVAVCRFGGTY